MGAITLIVGCITIGAICGRLLAWIMAEQGVTSTILWWAFTWSVYVLTDTWWIAMIAAAAWMMLESIVADLEQSSSESNAN
jgi:hypothetical protein